MAKELIFEIGSEELPARFIEEGRRGLERLLKEELSARSLSYRRLYTLATPRRLAAVVEGLSEQEPDRRIELKGPARRAAYDEQGRPTKALLGFMRSHSLSEADIKTQKTPKGEYIFATKHIKGRPTETLLPEILHRVVSGLSFPKTMRWADLSITYPRPLHWILAVYGGDPVEFSFGPIRASNRSRGHRFKAPEEFVVSSAEDYIKGLEERFVVVCPDSRRSLIASRMEELARKAGGVLLEDAELLQEVVNLVEYPVVIMGSFDTQFLSMPEEVVINAMREHQRYFSLRSREGSLMPLFITVANTPGDVDTIRKGNERVLRARLNDAHFYYQKDIEVDPLERVEELKGVVFQAGLGTSYDKVVRFTRLALRLAERLNIASPPEGGVSSVQDFLSKDMNPSVLKGLDQRVLNYITIGRAAMLAKSDLTSGMVGEFPKLQGIMGREYARLRGEPPEVYNAIYEHYLPQHSGDRLPSSHVSALIAIADKTDTVVGMFVLGKVPTGTQDPYGLRRLALGVIAILVERAYQLNLKGLVEDSASILAEAIEFDQKGTIEAVLEFFKERLRQRLLAQGVSFDSIDAVLSTRWFNLPDAVKRVKALEEFRADSAFSELIAAFKRVSNILKGASPPEKPQVSLLTEEAEKRLLQKVEHLMPQIRELSQKAQYLELFRRLASIKAEVDGFFDTVKVMAEDERLRQNRLGLLNMVRSLYIEVADLSKIAL